jgi:hypothetical protein
MRVLYSSPTWRGTTISVSTWGVQRSDDREFRYRSVLGLRRAADPRAGIRRRRYSNGDAMILRLNGEVVKDLGPPIREPKKGKVTAPLVYNAKRWNDRDRVQGIVDYKGRRVG